jgi:hypothetical protein
MGRTDDLVDPYHNSEMLPFEIRSSANNVKLLCGPSLR